MLGSITVWGAMHRRRAEKLAGELAGERAHALLVEADLVEAKLARMDLLELAQEPEAAEPVTITIVSSEGSTEFKEGFFRTKAQEAKCVACLKFKKKAKKVIKDLDEARIKAELTIDRVARKKKFWRTTALIAGTVATGFIIREVKRR